MNKISLSALESGKILCLYCGTLCEIDQKKCQHCHGVIHPRKPNANSKTWAYLLTSIILFFPANLLPITYTSSILSNVQADTIISSIIFLWQNGSYLIPIVIFLASIFTPFVKILILLYLLIFQNPTKPPILQTRLYSFIHFIGRWSMIDVFVVALLSALIHGKLASINPGLGIFAFCGVVVITMFATEAFDIRILWDNYRKYERTKN